jgi:hypothetical protein
MNNVVNGSHIADIPVINIDKPINEHKNRPIINNFSQIVSRQARLILAIDC